ncbi:MAG: bifunctional (p)ppGpp synthetase/guanosine-3',5'-bis(diphosphate) 3'-pyrophosphohydrolase [Acidimicrobiaceae bacterium]|nr:bifunctional (p)ppGpp synthetase/guanosine-3',5'-bis(diphosphate) 3'-pyrophosphohydrolase [Acidimicrobiaceae bacterium]
MATVTRVLPWRRGARRPAAAEIAPLLECYRQRHRDRSPDLIVRAFDTAAAAHEGQMRLSGEPYIRHPLAVATIVAKLGLDDVTIAASLLHDAVEDTDVALATIETDFGPEVTRIVDGVTKLDRVQYDTREQQQAASVRKMIVAIARDLRVLIIKLADRLHNLRTLAVLPAFKQDYIARETLDVYAPLAHRLGMQDLRQQLEDLAFAALEPRRYAEIDQMVQQRAPERDIYLEQVLGDVESRLAELGIKAEVTGRPKHLWSIYEKMVVKGRSFEDIFDLVGIRVLVDSVRDCYAALGSIHATWRPVQGRFKDYIAMPKFNLYQSLHTTVVGPAGKALEVQIRTRAMHDRAEHGVAAHWEYKDASPSEEMAWLSRIVDWQQETSDPAEFMSNLKIELDTDEVYVFTPKGKVIELPVGATPVDFAYSIHTDVGHACVGAKVNGRLVALDSRLLSGDVVEVFTTRTGGAGPSRDWLKFVASRRAANKIKQWYSRERRADAIENGRDDLIQALRREGLPAQRLLKDKLLDTIAEQLNYSSTDLLFLAIGEGHQSAASVAGRFARALQGDDADGEADRDRLPTTARRRGGHLRSDSDVGVHVEGLDDILIRLSQCCAPVPPDEIIGFVTRGRGVSVHRADCVNAIELAEGQTDRLIEVEWDTDFAGKFSTTISVQGLDRPGLLRDVTDVLAEHRLSIISAKAETGDDFIARMDFEFELADLSQLDSVLSSVLALEAVFEAYRVLPGRNGRTS